MSTESEEKKINKETIEIDGKEEKKKKIDEKEENIDEKEENIDEKEEKKRIGWNCLECTYFNHSMVGDVFVFRESCEMCQAPRPWYCQYCTFLNKGKGNRCMVCNRVNGDVERRKIMRNPDDSWNCPMDGCGALNLKSHQSCWQCAADENSIIIDLPSSMSIASEISSGGEIGDGGRVIDDGRRVIGDGGRVIDDGRRVIGDGGRVIRSGGRVIRSGSIISDYYFNGVDRDNYNPTSLMTGTSGVDCDNSNDNNNNGNNDNNPFTSSTSNNSSADRYLHNDNSKGDYRRLKDRPRRTELKFNGAAARAGDSMSTLNLTKPHVINSYPDGEIDEYETSDDELAEIKAYEIKTPEIKAYEIKTPEIKAYEIKTPEIKAYETKNENIESLSPKSLASFLSEQRMIEESTKKCQVIRTPAKEEETRKIRGSMDVRRGDNLKDGEDVRRGDNLKDGEDVRRGDDVKDSTVKNDEDIRRGDDLRRGDNIKVGGDDLKRGDDVKNIVNHILLTIDGHTCRLEKRKVIGNQTFYKILSPPSVNWVITQDPRGAGAFINVGMIKSCSLRIGESTVVNLGNVVYKQFDGTLALGYVSRIVFNEKDGKLIPVILVL